MLDDCDGHLAPQGHSVPSNQLLTHQNLEAGPRPNMYNASDSFELEAYLQGILDGSASFDTSMDLDDISFNTVATTNKRQKKVGAGYPCSVVGCSEIFDRICDL